jgi:hypothetical protein
MLVFDRNIRCDYTILCRTTILQEVQRGLLVADVWTLVGRGGGDTADGGAEARRGKGLLQQVSYMIL